MDNHTLLNVPMWDQYHIYTDFGCMSTIPGEFAGQVTSFFLTIVGGVTLLGLIYGAGLIATSRADPGKISKGKRVVFGSIAGLLFAIFGILIIRFIAGGLGLPGLGGV